MTGAYCMSFTCRQQLAAAIATDELLPLTRDDTPAPFAALLKACWRLDPSERPSAQQMLQYLQQMQPDRADCPSLDSWRPEHGTDVINTSSTHV